MTDIWVYMKHKEMPDGKPVYTPRSSFDLLHVRNGWYVVDADGEKIKKPPKPPKPPKPSNENSDEKKS